MYVACFLGLHMGHSQGMSDGVGGLEYWEELEGRRLEEIFMIPCFGVREERKATANFLLLGW